VEGEPPVLVGGTPFTVYQANPGSPPGPQIINDGDGDGEQPGHLQVSLNVPSQSNSVIFEKTSDTADQIVANFKIRQDGTADGMSFLILDAAQYGDTEPFEQGVGEEPNLLGVIGIGFDIYDNDEEGDEARVDPIDPEGCGGEGTCVGRRANHVSLHFGSEVVPAARFELDEIDLGSGEWHEVTVTATEVDDGMEVSVELIDGSDGSVHTAFEDEFVFDAFFPDGARAGFGARTGGAVATQDVDDLFIRWTAGDAAPGDYNEDGVLDALDIDLQSAEMKKPPGQQDRDKFDHNDDNLVNEADRTIWVKELRKTWVGDANFDNEFNSGDLVVVFAAGKYETGDMAGWAEGDWSGDMVFDSSDLVVAFADGGYEQGPAAVAAVPEPSSIVLLFLGTLMMVRRRR
jgi:hypothetical protein